MSLELISPAPALSMGNRPTPPRTQCRPDDFTVRSDARGRRLHIRSYIRARDEAARGAPRTQIEVMTEPSSVGPQYSNDRWASGGMTGTAKESGGGGPGRGESFDQEAARDANAKDH